MPVSRRTFIRQSAIAGGTLLALGKFPISAFAEDQGERLTILHTNDVHSWLFPFPDDDKRHPGQGGVEARAALISKIREAEKNVLLFDAGDIFQGTPYFNMFKGEPEIKAMSLMQYDAATMGNHDFDAGLDGFAKQLPHATFPFLTANYDFSGTVLEGKTIPYKIFNKGSLKIGVFGLGIQLYGLVSPEAYGGAHYHEPVAIAQELSAALKQKHHCDMVICLSHLGYKYNYHKVSDCVLAAETEHIDLIIGGHTHAFLDEPVLIQNRKGRDVIINQAGWAGVRLGRLDFVFNSKKNAKLSKSNTVIIRK